MKKNLKYRIRLVVDKIEDGYVDCIEEVKEHIFKDDIKTLKLAKEEFYWYKYNNDSNA